MTVGTPLLLDNMSQQRSYRDLVKSQGFSFSLLYILLIFWIVSLGFFSNSLSVLTFVGAGFLAIFLETLRFRLGTKRPFLVKFNAVIDRYLLLFITGGYICGIVIDLILLFFDDLMTPSDPPIPPSLVLFASVLFSSFLLGMSFYRIMKEDSYSKARIHLFSGPGEVSYLLFFFYITSLLPPLLLSLSFSDNLTRSFEDILDLTLLSAFILPGVEIISSVLIVDIGRYVLFHTQLRYTRKEDGAQFLLKLTLFTVILYGVVSLMLSSVSLLFLLLTIFSLAILVISHLRTMSRAEMCDRCGLQKVTGNFQTEYGLQEKRLYCNNCDSDTPAIEFLGLIGRRARAPKCPVCKTPWRSFSRKCNNCGFMILLSCPNCEQTINPLWKKCDSCGIPLTPIPSLALDTRVGVSRSKQFVSIWFFTSIILFNLVMETYLWLYLRGVDPSKFPFGHDVYFFSSSVKILMFMIAAVAILYLNVQILSPYFLPIAELVGKFIFFPVMVLLLYSTVFMVWTTYDILTVVISFSPLLSAFFSGLFVALAFYFWKREWVAFTDFRPTVGYDPEFQIEINPEVRSE